MCEPMTREDAERICKAHGWKLERFDPYYCFVIVPDWHQSVILPPAVVHALDPDRPPSSAALERLANGCRRMADDGNIVANMWSIHHYPDLIARAWEDEE